MSGQTQFGDERSDSDNQTGSVLETLPPERLLDTAKLDLIRGGVSCMRSIETVKEYVAYENSTEQREMVLRLLDQRAAELRELS